MYHRLAWRNLWRNKRRTFITSGSIVLAVVLAITMRSLQLGSYEKMIENVVGYYSGYIQIQGKQYWKSRSLDDGFVYNDTLITKIDAIKEVTSIAPRLESVVLSGGSINTKGALIIGVDPQKEENAMQLASKIVKGTYFDETLPVALLAEGLANSLELNVGDSVVIIGQGYHASSAVAKYKIIGIVHFGSPELNRSLMYLPLKEAYSLFGGEIITSVAIMLKNPKNMQNVKRHLQLSLGDNFVVKDWKDMIPDLDQAIKADNAGGLIMIGVLYLIITFGIFGTLIMMLAERKQEFGIMISIGMKRIQLALVVFLESLYIGMIGTLVGITMSIPLVAWLFYHPIQFTTDAAKGFEDYGFQPVMMASVDPSIFISQAGLVLLLSIVLSLYSFFKLLRIDALTAMQK